MKLKTAVPKPDFPFEIRYEDKLLNLGSCFAEHIGARLSAHLFNTCINPFGIIYHPLPMANALNRLLQNQKYTEDELIQHNELFHSLDHHGQFSSPSRAVTLEKINKAYEVAREYLSNAQYLLITFGTSWVYYHRERKQYVANCHKLPQEQFEKKMSSLEEMTNAWIPLINKLKQLNPRIKIIFTVSPVRHLKDGLRANQLSKAQLHLLIEALSQTTDELYYFPAYELMMDELRDYRFYDSDLLHPNELAQSYIWQFFCASVFSDATRDKLQAVAQINKASNHRPFHPELATHQQFVYAQLKKIEALKPKIPTADFSFIEKQFVDQLVK